MVDLPNTRFINFVDSPVAVTFSQAGSAFIHFAPAATVIDVTGFRKGCFCVGQTSATTVVVGIGKIANATLSQELVFLRDDNIHCFDIIGPQVVVILRGGTPNTTEDVQFWLYLTS
jgi:hypothetical protein